jgi:putative transposase
MNRTFKYRLLGNKDIFNKAEEWLYLCRSLYNIGLQQRMMIYKQGHRYITCYNQMNQLPELKSEFTEYKKVSAQTLQEVLERLDRTYKSFFGRIKRGEKAGFPRFKGESRYNSFTLKKSGWQLNGRYLIVKNLGKFKLRLSRPMEGNIKTISIKRETTGKWYVYFCCGDIPIVDLPKTDKVIGIDVGVKSYLIDSMGSKVENPKFLKSASCKLRVKQRKLSRAKKGSGRRKDTKLQVSKCHEKVRNQRGDFLHKLANQYIKGYDIIYIENLQVRNMIKNHKLARDIKDCSWGLFFTFLSYKAEEAGRKVVRINPKNTSKTCSNCGEINQDLTLNDRQWVCKSCGVLHDRDYNAAKNIKRVGQTQQALTCANRQSVACESMRITKSGVPSQVHGVLRG